MKLQAKMIRNHKKSHQSSRSSSTSRKVRKKIRARKESNNRLSPNTSRRRKMARMETVKSKAEGTIAVRSTTIRVVIKAKRSRCSNPRSNRSNRINKIKR